MLVREDHAGPSVTITRRQRLLESQTYRCRRWDDRTLSRVDGDAHFPHQIVRRRSRRQSRLRGNERPPTGSAGAGAHACPAPLLRGLIGLKQAEPFNLKASSNFPSCTGVVDRLYNGESMGDSPFGAHGESTGDSPMACSGESAGDSRLERRAQVEQFVIILATFLHPLPRDAIKLFCSEPNFLRSCVRTPDSERAAISSVRFDPSTEEPAITRRKARRHDLK